MTDQRDADWMDFPALLALLESSNCFSNCGSMRHVAALVLGGLVLCSSAGPVERGKGKTANAAQPPSLVQPLLSPGAGV